MNKLMFMKNRIRKTISNENFISLFIDNKEFLDFCIRTICMSKGIEVNYKDLSLRPNPIPIEQLDEKFKQLDLVAEADNYVFNIEANNDPNSTTLKKNVSYLMEMYAKSTRKGKEYNTNQKFIQINFDNDNRLLPEALSIAYLYDKDSNTIVVDNFSLLYLDIAKCYKIFYNLVVNDKTEEIPDYIRLGAFFYSDNLEELDLILGNMLGNELKSKVIKKVKEINTMRDDYTLTPKEAKEYGEFLLWLEKGSRRSWYERGP